MSYTNAKIFLDTNILVYAIDQREPQKRVIIRRLLDGVATERIVISTQTLIEFIAVARRKTLVSFETLNKLLQLHQFVQVVTIDSLDVLAAVDIIQETQLRIFDCMMIQAAAKAGCEQLWSEDMTHGQVIRGVRIVNPFHTEGIPS